MHEDIEWLKDTIAEDVFITNKEEQIETYEDPNAWIFDFRKVLLRGEVANTISDIFYERFKNDHPFQIGALEVAGIPLATSLMNKFYQNGHADINAFFIRKSRKKSGLMRMVEGTIHKNTEIILVDDIINSGNSLWRLVEILDELGYKTKAIWTILKFRNTEYYQRFYDRGIELHNLFALQDFSSLHPSGFLNSFEKRRSPKLIPFETKWRFRSTDPSYGYVVEKSQPVLDEQNVYFGADNRTFWALKQEDGTVAWKYQVGFPSKKKSIFSNPALYEGMVIFGAYDGNLYALNKKTGKPKWIYMEADWIGSSPAIADDINTVFIGLEFGLVRKHGGVAALDVQTGKPVWTDHSHQGLTHCSPLYIQKHKQVVIGSNDGIVRLYNAKNGKKIWEFTTFGGMDYDPIINGGFGSGDIKSSFVYDTQKDQIIFGSIDGHLYIIDRKTGTLSFHYKCLFGIWSTPLIHDKKVYFTSVDKRIRCLDLDSYALIFDRDLDNTRIFSTPTMIEGRLYVGTNAGRVHELDSLTGESFGYFQVTERITNTIIYNEQTGAYFLPTYANEVFCLQRKRG